MTSLTSDRTITFCEQRETLKQTSTLARSCVSWSSPRSQKRDPTWIPHIRNMDASGRFYQDCMTSSCSERLFEVCLTGRTVPVLNSSSVSGSKTRHRKAQDIRQIASHLTYSLPSGDKNRFGLVRTAEAAPGPQLSFAEAWSGCLLPVSVVWERLGS